MTVIIHALALVKMVISLLLSSTKTAIEVSLTLNIESYESFTCDIANQQTSFMFDQSTIRVFLGLKKAAINRV